MNELDIKIQRTRLGLSQLELAEKLGVPVNTIARWERGELKIERPQVLALAIAHLHCSNRKRRKAA